MYDPVVTSPLLSRTERMSSSTNNTTAVYKTAVAKPEKYSGKKEELKGFLRAVRINLLERPEIKTNKQKVLFTLSFMTEGKAGDWAGDIFDVITENDVLPAGDANKQPDPWNYTEFLKQLKKRFEDVAEQKKAWADLDSMRQGKDSVQDYLDKFDRLARTANFDDDCMRIALAESRINTPLLEKMYGMETVPSTWEAWCEKAVLFDDQWRRVQEIKKRRNPLYSAQKKDTPRKPFQVTSGLGAPMDLDQQKAQKKCFKCGKPGETKIN
jgi:hypothetical protein